MVYGLCCYANILIFSAVFLCYSFGLAWNLKDKGKLLSGSDDRLVCLWDLNKNPTVDENKVRFLSATRTFSAHEDVVEDVDWHPDHKHIFASVGDDKVSCLGKLLSRDKIGKQEQGFPNSDANLSLIYF